MRRVLVMAVCLGLGAGWMAGAQAVAASRFTVDDLTKIVRVTDPQISPDGKTVAVVVARANLKEDRYDAEVVLVDVATKASRVMTHDRLGVSAPRWSKDGTKLAYLAQDANKKNQVWVLPLTGGDSMQLTKSKTGVTLFAWKPDGSAIAYVAADEEPEKKDEAKFDDAFEVGDSDFLQRTRPLPVHIWTIATSGGEAKRLTSGAWSLPITFAPAGPPSQITWTPDGTSLVFVKAKSAMTGDGDSTTVQVMDVATGTMRALTGETQHESNPVLARDGTQVAYAFPRDGKPRNETEIHVVPIAGGKGVDVTRGLDRDATGLAWMPDGKAMLVAANDGSTVGYWLQTVGGPAKRLQMGAVTPRGDMVVGEDGRIVFTGTEVGRPAELYTMDGATAAPVRLTSVQTVTDGMELGKSETVTWTSDKEKVNAIVTYPPEFVTGKKYPLVLFIHGGPTSASLETFSPAAQLFAAQGWVVMEPNYRGSNNAGNAFQSSIVGDAGAGPGRDVMAGLEMLKKRGFVDETKIAVSGWSYGGYMTSWLIGNYPTVWKVAVAGAPVTDLVDQYTLSDTNVRRAAALGGSPYTNDRMKLYREQSPITYAPQAKAPTLIMSDVGDWRVTTTQAYKLYHALRDNGVTTQFIAYPVPGHFPADPLRARDVYRRWTAWLAVYLNEDGTPVKAAK